MKNRLMLIFSCGLALSLSSCSSTPKQSSPPADQIVVSQNPEQMNIQFEGNCAMHVAQGFVDRLGSSKYHVDYKSKTYFFETADERDAFLKSIDTNVKKANLRWAKAKANLGHD